MSKWIKTTDGSPVNPAHVQMFYVYRDYDRERSERWTLAAVLAGPSGEYGPHVVTLAYVQTQDEANAALRGLLDALSISLVSIETKEPA